MVDFEGLVRQSSALAALVFALSCSKAPMDDIGAGGMGSGGTAGSGGAAAGGTGGDDTAGDDSADAGPGLNDGEVYGEGYERLLEGAVQKGPLVTGSSITLSVLDAQLEPTGQVFDTQTVDDRGEFRLSFAATGPIALQGQGSYYNELSGAPSGSSIALRAFYAPSQASAQRVYVNVVTHLTAERIAALVRGGVEFSAAVARAEGELVRELDITGDDYQPSAPGTSMTLAGADIDDNAYLLGVSATFIQLASDRSGGAADAPLQETLNSFALGLADGTLDAGQKTAIAAALARVDVQAVIDNLTARLAQLGSSEPAPNPNRVLDQDGDGLSNADDVCPFSSGPRDDAGDGAGCPPAEDCCVPRGGPGQPCNADASCSSGLECIEAAACGPGQPCCLPVGAEGQACVGGPSGSCSGELSCTSGEACALFELDYCCATDGGNGQTCSNDLEAPVACNDGLVCLTGDACAASGPVSCCRVPGELRSTCLENEQCGGGLLCDTSGEFCDTGESTCCVEPRGEGEPCLLSSVCGPGLGCVNDNDSCNGGQCCLPAGGAGEPCPRDAPCDAGLVCDSCAAFDEGCCFPAP